MKELESKDLRKIFSDVTRDLKRDIRRLENKVDKIETGGGSEGLESIIEKIEKKLNTLESKIDTLHKDTQEERKQREIFKSIVEEEIRLINGKIDDHLTDIKYNIEILHREDINIKKDVLMIRDNLFGRR